MNLFLQESSKKNTNKFGKCCDCDIELTGWEQLHKRDISDAAYTFELLKKEKIRHHYWHVEIEPHAVNHALRKGRIELHEAVIKRLKQSIGIVQETPDGKKRPYRDGYQTPYSGSNSIYYAQHATASCCRKCLESWHGISQERDLTECEITYLTDLIMLYLNERLPSLTDHRQPIPRIRNTTNKCPSKTRKKLAEKRSVASKRCQEKEIIHAN